MNFQQRIHWLFILLAVVLLLSFGFGGYLLLRNRFPGSRTDSRQDQSPSVEALLRDGETYLKKHQAEQALIVYRQVLAQQPSFVAAQLGLAQGELLAGREAMAAQEYERLLKLDGNHIVGLLQLAQLYAHEKKHWAHSEDIYRRYLKLKPSTANPCGVGSRRWRLTKGRPDQVRSDWQSRYPPISPGRQNWCCPCGNT